MKDASPVFAVDISVTLRGGPPLFQPRLAMSDFLLHALLAIVPVVIAITSP